jgi:uncharacterized membrane protein
MDLARLLRHLFVTRRRTRRLFPDATLDAIESAIREGESLHAGEVRFAIETALHPRAIWRGITPRERARGVFAELGVWDTERRSGILVYVLVADRDVEIVADRGYSGGVAQEEWEAACRAMEERFRAGDFAQGSVAGIRAVSEIAARCFPGGGGRNELPDRPSML